MGFLIKLQPGVLIEDDSLVSLIKSTLGKLDIETLSLSPHKEHIYETDWSLLGGLLDACAFSYNGVQYDTIINRNGFASDNQNHQLSHIVYSDQFRYDVGISFVNSEMIRRHSLISKYVSHLESKADSLNFLGNFGRLLRESITEIDTLLLEYYERGGAKYKLLFQKPE